MNRWKWLLLTVVLGVGAIVVFLFDKQVLANSFAADGRLQLLRVVVTLGANINQEHDGSYPLIRAAKGRQEPTVKYLLSHKADVNVRDQEWDTPVMRAIQANDVSILRDLIAARADINLADKGGLTAVDYALRASSYEMVETLVKAGADVNTPDGRGETPLIGAAHIGNTDIMKLLLKSGADPSYRDKGGHSAIEYVQNFHDPAVILLLRNVYLVPIGDAPEDEINALVSHYQEKFRMAIKVLPRMKLDESDYDTSRGQVIAENLLKSMSRAYPEYSDNWATVLIGITGQDMYPLGEPWQFCFGWRAADGRSAVISTARLVLHFPDEIPEQASLTQRLQKVVTKDIGLLYFWKSSSHNPKSVLYDGMTGVQDLDIATENF